jgi:NTP pyrophosphatase (non-canonical NTP hydrolase)
MKSVVHDVEYFLAAGEVPRNKESAELYLRLVVEEINELMVGMQKLRKDESVANYAEVADAIADSIWVLAGLGSVLDLPMGEVWNEVAISNHAKIAHDGKIHKRADGKILKPEGWRPPAIESLIAQHKK